jgi:hypothetical protein
VAGAAGNANTQGPIYRTFLLFPGPEGNWRAIWDGFRNFCLNCQPDEGTMVRATVVTSHWTREAGHVSAITHRTVPVRVAGVATNRASVARWRPFSTPAEVVRTLPICKR